MNRILLYAASAALALTLGVSAQPPAGRGPHAYGDKDKDGICDVTGQPVGKGRGQGMAGQRRGNNCPCGGQQGCRCRGGANANSGSSQTPQATPGAKQ